MAWSSKSQNFGSKSYFGLIYSVIIRVLYHIFLKASYIEIGLFKYKIIISISHHVNKELRFDGYVLNIWNIINEMRFWKIVDSRTNILKDFVSDKGN